jgi:hypothetical protein
VKFVILKHYELDGGRVLGQSGHPGHVEIPYVFPDSCLHAELPDCLGREVLSAGFVCRDEIEKTRLVCYGSALECPARPEDTPLINERHVIIDEDLTDNELIAEAPKGFHWLAHGEHHMVVTFENQDERWERLFSQMAMGLGKCAGCCHYWS